MSRIIAQALAAGRLGLEKLGESEGKALEKWLVAVDKFINGEAGRRYLRISEVADANATVTEDFDVYEWTSLTATRTATLPSFADTTEGRVFYFRDSAGTAALGTQINIVPSGTDQIESVASMSIAWPHGRLALVRGATRWRVLEQGFLHLVTGGSNYRFAVVNPATGASENASIRAVTATGGGSPFFRLVRTGVGQFDWTVQSTGALEVRDVTSGNTQLQFISGSVIMSGGATIATTATDGFFYNRFWSGRPTGTPTSRGFVVPNGYDATNYRFDSYINGAWESVPIRCLNVNVTDTGNVGAGEDDLHTYTLPAGTLGRDAESVEVEYALTFAANANNKRVRAYFGATAILDTGAGAQSGGTLVIRARVFRTGAATQKAHASFACTIGSAFGVSTANLTTPAETLANAITIKVTGEGVANNDIVARTSSVRLVNLGV